MPLGLSWNHELSSLFFPECFHGGALCFQGEQMKLTDENLHLCVLPDGRPEKLYADDDLTGFGIRVRRDVKGRTKRKWFYQYRSRNDGSQHRINLGNVDSPAAVPATRARQAATEMSVRVQVGGNPQKERATAKKGRKRLLLDEALKYLSDRKEGIVGKRPMRLSTYKAAKRYFELHWGALAKRPVASVTDDEVKAQLRKIIEQHGKTAAIRAKGNLSAFYVWALKEGIAKTNPTLTTHDIAENPPRDRVFDDGEIRAIWSACRDDDFGRIVKLLMFTGCRRDEIGALRWSEIDFDTSTVTIPATRTKSGRKLELTLPPPAIDVLRQAPRKADRELLFGQSGAAFSRWSYEKMSIDKRLAENGHQLKRWTNHDFRRTVRTRLGELGIEPHIAELVIGHAAHKTGVVGTYDHYSYAPKIKEALARWADRLLEIIGPPGNVVSLKRSA
jgi:integrase